MLTCLAGNLAIAAWVLAEADELVFAVLALLAAFACMTVTHYLDYPTTTYETEENECLNTYANTENASRSRSV